MWFLLKTAFWLTVIIMLIPVDESALERPAAPDAPPVNAVEAAAAAQQAIDDMGGFCGRNPDVCEIGGRLGHTFALKARTGALWVYSTLDRQLGGDGDLPAEETGSLPDRGTLSGSDLAPGWAGPDTAGAAAAPGAGAGI